MLSIWAPQALLLGTNFLAGLAKVKSLLLEIGSDSNWWANLGSTAHYYFVAKILERGDSSWLTSPAGDFLSDNNGLLGVLVWVGVMGFECSALAVVFRPKWLRFWGVLQVLFHTLAYVILKINFLPAVVLAVLILIYPPLRQAQK
jgi:hypothetical protein